jgi:hypothetical protein
MCDTRRYGLLDGNALVGRSRYEQSSISRSRSYGLAMAAPTRTVLYVDDVCVGTPRFLDKEDCYVSQDYGCF